MYSDSTVTTSPVDNLIGGGFPLVTKSITLAEGQDLVRGTVIGKLANGKFEIAKDEIVDPATPAVVPYAVLAQDTDATSADKKTICYLTGQFVESEMTFSGDLTMTGVVDNLRALGIFVTSSVDNANV